MRGGSRFHTRGFNKGNERPQGLRESDQGFTPSDSTKAMQDLRDLESQIKTSCEKEIPLETKQDLMERKRRAVEVFLREQSKTAKGLEAGERD